MTLTLHVVAIPDEYPTSFSFTKEPFDVYWVHQLHLPNLHIEIWSQCWQKHYNKNVH